MTKFKMLHGANTNKDAKGIVLCLKQLKEECREQGFEFPALMMEATISSLEEEMGRRKE